MIEGKTKTLIEKSGNLIVTTKDILTANDAAKKENIKVAIDKNKQTCALFAFLQKHDIKTHFIEQIDDTSFLAKKCNMIPIECVARFIATGSFLKRYPSYENGANLGVMRIEFFHKLAYIAEEDRLMPEAEARDKFMVEGKWHRPVVTDPFIIFDWGNWRTKRLALDSKQGFNIHFYDPKKTLNIHDVIFRKESDITPREYDTIRDELIKISQLIQKAWHTFNISLVDIKLEFGRCASTGEILLADVIDNDSWRIWPNGDVKQQLDKQAFRDGNDTDDIISNYKKVTKFTKKFPQLNFKELV